MADSGHHGRLSSWIAVTIMMVGFIAGGLGLILGPLWWLFWAGAGVVAAGGILALAVDIFADVVVDDPRVPSERAHRTALGQEGD